MSKHQHDGSGLPEVYIALAEMVIRTAWSCAYAIALVIVGIIQAALDPHRGQVR